MLNSAWRAAICVLTGIGMTVTAASTAHADGGVDVRPCAERDICTGVHDPGSTPTPGGGGTSGGGGGSDTCQWQGETVPCYLEGAGWFSDGCYYRLADPQPLPGEEAWDGHDSSQGAVYDRICRSNGTNEWAPSVFLAQPPAGPPPKSPVELAWDALKKITVGEPVLHAAPQSDAVVGSPVWLWFDAAKNVVAPDPSTVQGTGYTVTTRITLKKVVWSVDDGPAGDRISTFECNDAGTPFGSGGTPSCSHVFAKSSKDMADHAYTLKVRLYWDVTATTSTQVPINTTGFNWTTDGTQTLRVPVNEVQLLN